jgi:pyruvate dehydrogenase E2 component (dihydrolipoamide acetyltransferase)
MATPVVMPKLGNSVESSIIVGWRKEVGESIAVGDILCEVETDKATVDVESPVAGVLLAQFFKQGDDVPVMTNIAAVGAAGEDISGLAPAGSTSLAATPQPVAAASPAPSAVSVPNVPSATPANGHLAISPRARNLANRRSVNTDSLSGTGPGGRIIERDVLAALERQPALTPVAKSMVESGEFAAPTQGSGSRGRVTKKDLIPTAEPLASLEPAAEAITIVPMKGVRKIIATRMLNSLQTTAQLTLNSFADARAIQQYRAVLKSSDEALGLRKVTINDLILFTVSRVLPQFPDLNALLLPEAIHQYQAVHLGFAVDTPRGLLVPVIRNAHLLSLKQMAAEARRLAQAAQDGKMNPADLEGGTFTVTNLGSFGIETFTPVLNPPQVAILGVGSIHLKAVEAEEGLEFTPHIGLSLTIDHQAVDGAPGARFLKAFGTALTQFETLLAL